MQQKVASNWICKTRATPLLILKWATPASRAGSLQPPLDQAGQLGGQVAGNARAHFNCFATLTAHYLWSTKAPRLLSS